MICKWEGKRSEVVGRPMKKILLAIALKACKRRYSVELTAVNTAMKLAVNRRS